jgi:sugar lactone lactonase YvrE
MSAPAAAVIAAPAPAQASGILPATISLPNGWRPEGIALGLGSRFYVGSLADGAIYRGSVLTGEGSVFVPGTAGTQAVGLEIDDRLRIWACGNGGASVYSELTGEKLAFYPLGGTFVNDAAATRSAVYFTDSQRPVLYKVPFGRFGKLPATGAGETIALPGGLGDAGAFNNGIVSTPDGKLIIVQSNADRLYLFDPASATATQIDLGGASVLRGDGMLLRGRDLYVVRNRLNLIAKFRLGHGYTSATLTGEITSPGFQVPTTIGAFGPYLYAVNARFDVTPTPDTTYTVVRVNA